MEEKTGSDSRYQRQKMAFLTREIREFASRELKNCQTLKAITEQFKIKQSAKPTFQRQQFSESAYAHFVEINTFFEKIISQTTIFPILDKYSLLLSSICSQYYRIFRFSNEKWDNQYKAVEQLLKNKTIIPPFKSDMCLSCSQNIWHQHIKTEKHQIYNLRIQDPFYYYNEAVVNRKQINGEEADHKKLQQKLSELALGVQMEQSCLRQILQTLNHQQKQVANQLQHPNLAESENISLPVMPMLRSVFQYTSRANKKVTSQIGIQTVQLSEKPVQVVKIPQPNFNEIISENEKIQCKLITELADKTVQIKELQLKITQSEKIEKDLKAQHSILIEQNISLQKRNSLLESQLSMTKLKNVTTKFKLASKKKSSQKTRQEMSMVANTKSFNYHETSNQQNMAERSMDHFSGGKVRGNVAYESSKFKAQQTPNKTMFIPNLYQNQKINRQSVTPGHPGSTLSIQRGSDKLEDEGLNSVIDFPSLRQSIHSNDPYRQLQSVKFEQMKPGQKKFDEKQQTKNIRKQANLASELAKSKRKLKQITKKIINNDAGQINSWTRSQNTSPDLQQKKIRRLGKIQDRQSLLRILYDSEVKVNTQKVVNFDIFKKGYENFVLNIVGTNDSDSERNKLAKMKHLHKKSTVSIKQYYRNDFAESKDEANKVAKLNEHSIQSINRYSRLSACFRDIMNNIYSDGNQIPVVASSESSGKSLLTNEQIRLITEISAYMIQLKVNSFDAYSKIKTIISIQSVAADRKKGSNIAEQNRQLKQSISTIIKSHRSCQRFEGHAYCKHISVFIQNIITLMEK